MALGWPLLQGSVKAARTAGKSLRRLAAAELRISGALQLDKRLSHRCRWLSSSNSRFSSAARYCTML
jgi:hypothetical protein